MARIRRTIHKTNPGQVRLLDDQFWPLVVAMGVLSGFLAGSVLAYLDLDDPRWYANAWTWLLAVPIVLAAALIVLARTGNRALRRTLQLSAILGITLHLLFFIVAMETDVFGRISFQMLTVSDEQPRKSSIKVPEYLAWQHDPQQRARQDTEQPTQVDLPDPEVAAQTKEPTESAATDLEPQPRPILEPEDTERPNIVKRAETGEAVPRQNADMSKLSRREAPQPDRSPQVVPVPDSVPSPARSEDPPRPLTRDERLERPPAAEKRKRASDTPPEVVSAAEPQGARRQDSPSSQPAVPDSETLPRTETAAQVAPRPDAVASDATAAVASPAESPSLTPNPTLASKQETRAPKPIERSEAPPSEMATETNRVRRDPQQPAPERVQIAAAPQPVRNRQPRVTTRPDVIALVEAEPNREAATSESTVVVPANTALTQQTSPDTAAVTLAPRASAPIAADAVAVEAPARRSATVPIPDAQPAAANPALPTRSRSDATATGALAERVSPVDSEAVAVMPRAAEAGPIPTAKADLSKQGSGAVTAERSRLAVETTGDANAPQTASRRVPSSLETMNPALIPGTSNETPRRAVREAESPASPLALENPVRAEPAATQADTLSTPTPLALSRSETGVAGRGLAANLGAAEPAPESPATIASGSAERAVATQTLVEGPALAPQEASLVRSSRAGSHQPGTILAATPAPSAALPGSTQTADVNANAGAMLTHATSNAERGNVTAAKGAQSADTGPTILVTESGTGRAAGGGQPELNAGASAAAVPRAQPNLDVTPQSIAGSLAAQPMAPPGQGGGQPEASDMISSSPAIVNARLASPSERLGGPPGTGGGPETVPSASVGAPERRGRDSADVSGPAAATDVARVSRKGVRDTQLDLEWGVADLSAGNAADHTDSGEPGAITAADAATTSAGKMATNSGAASLPRATTEEPVAPVGEIAGGLAARIEAAEGILGEPRTGGGTGTPQRSGRGPEVAARVTADAIQVAGMPESDGDEDTLPRSADGTARDMASARVSPSRSSSLSGGKGAAATVDETPDGVALVGSGRRDKTPSAAETPPVGGDQTANELVPRANPQLPFGTIEPVTVEGIPGLDEALAAANGPDGEQVLDAGDAEVGPVSRLAGPVLPVEVQAPSEEGGIGILLARDVGLKARQALETSTDIQLESNRFSRNQRGGKLEAATTAAIPAQPFRGRMQRGQAKGDPVDGSGPQTEEAVELGLVFLHKLQLPDGRWTLDRNADTDGMPQMASDTAATGLALLAFQGAGYHHLDHRYAEVVRHGIEFLVRHQQPDGNLYVPMDAESNRVVVFYSHSIAALALCEAYGMTQDAALREPAQRALNYIVTTQNQQRGGWRYSPGVSTDTSVTGWMMMALKSGELANLKVPSETYVGISRWLDSAQASKSQPHLYCYNPYATEAAEQRGGRQPTRTMTSVGLLMRLYLGWRRDNPNLARGAKYLAQSPPAIGTTSNPQRDTYYWYYATQVMFHMGGQTWRDWNRHLHPVLVKGQIRNGPLAGSWDPARPVADRWGPHAGRLYVTTMNLLSLEVTYRHLPLYEDTAK